MRIVVMDVVVVVYVTSILVYKIFLNIFALF